jgi:DNA-binding protein HU-beta
MVHAMLFQKNLMIVRSKDMTKADLVDRISSKTGITKMASEKALNAYLASLKEVLLSDGKLNITGLGTFAVEERKARTGRNPRTGAAIAIPATKVVKFRPGRKLKDIIN